MKNIYKISAIVLLILTIVITSCKKDAQIIEGCTDAAAMNFQSSATSNDGSCVYAYDIAQGTWYFTFDCGEFDPSSLGIPLPNSVNVKGEGDGELTFELSTLDETIAVNGTINNNGDINIPAQSISLASLPIPVTVSGEGLIESQDSGNLKLKYSVLTFDFSCDADLSREEESGSGE